MLVPRAIAPDEAFHTTPMASWTASLYSSGTVSSSLVPWSQPGALSAYASTLMRKSRHASEGWGTSSQLSSLPPVRRCKSARSGRNGQREAIILTSVIPSMHPGTSLTAASTMHATATPNGHSGNAFPSCLCRRNSARSGSAAARSFWESEVRSLRQSSRAPLSSEASSQSSSWMAPASIGDPRNRSSHASTAMQRPLGNPLEGAMSAPDAALCRP
mmetsp:Transcript_4668/g.10309  ORF Transcript_4668/g.10309 Transcript_4668/m.10309 type:complete len:216 (-) Transcript_4668:9-656(-)